MAKCEIEGCENSARARGLCRSHGKEASCSVEGCSSPVLARTYCTTHYSRWRKTGDAGEGARRRKGKRPCRVVDCANDAITRDDLCPTHRRRKRLYGDEHGSLRLTLACVICGEPAMHGTQTIDRCEVHAWDRVLDLYLSGQHSGATDPSGYVYLKVRKSRKAVHRMVMERELGRELLPYEEVHHRNGHRGDNRRSNLELWSKSQPGGQRVEDKVVWAVELLRLYAPEYLKEPRP